MTIYVTGGAGFIGSNLIKHLNTLLNDDIYIVDKLRSNGKWKNLLGLKFIDLIDPTKFNFDHINAKDVVVHLGACSSTKEQDADYLWLNNVSYSVNLVTDAVRNGARVVYASSAAVYGDGSKGFSESGTDLRPLNPYGYSKLRTDEVLAQAGVLNHCVGLRLFNVWGNREEHKGSMRSFLSVAKEKFKNGDEVVVYNKESIKLERDFVYVKDVCRIITACITQSNVNGIFNVGTGVATEWETLAKQLVSAMNLEHQKVSVIPLPPHIEKQYQYSTKADIGKLMSAFPLLTFTNLQEALKDFINDVH